MELKILGAGGHARSVGEAALFNDPTRTLVFIDEGASGEHILGFPVIPADDLHGKDFIVAVGDNIRRAQLTLAPSEGRLVSVVTSDATVTIGARIGTGTFVGHQAYIGPDAGVGTGCIVNTRSIIEHEVQVGDFVQIGPAAVIGGRATLGERSFIGMGAVVMDQVSVAPDCIVGAGAVVVRSLEEPGTYVGVPARKI